MAERVTLDLPSELAERVRVVAARTQRRFEEVLVDWIGRGGAEPDVESLPDDEILALCDREMDAERQEALSDFLQRNREGLLSEADRCRLDELMRIYRIGLVRKAQALRVAVARGLKPRLS
ncbi:MAG: hypothetical protein HUU20_21625 [Pirellulales bacterium]|nr:hypothetical protein [Pirellulales bacterium]